MARPRLLRFSRVRLEAPEGGPTGAALDLARSCLAPEGRLQVVERLAPVRPWSRMVERLAEAEERLAALVGELAPSVQITGGVELQPEDGRPSAEGDALLVLSERPGPTSWPELDRVLASGWSLLVPGADAPGRLVLLVPQGASRGGVPLPLLRRLLPEQAAVELLLPAGAEGDHFSRAEGLAELLEVAALEGRVFFNGSPSEGTSLSDRLAQGVAPMVVLPVGWSSGLRTVFTTLDVYRQDRASLLLLAPQPVADSARWVASDLVALPGAGLLGSVERVGALGLVEAPPGGLSAEQMGQRSGPHSAVAGQLALPDLGGSLVTLASAEQPDEVRALVKVLRPGGEPIHLIALDGEQAALPEPGARAWGLRLQAHQGLARLRQQAHKLGLETVIDAGALLRDGSPTDLPGEALSLRAQRVAARLAAAGFPLAGQPGAELDRLACLTGARPTTATRLHLEWDNGRYRQRLVELFDAATASICLQSYQVQDDPAVREVELALMRAAARGVAVRVLADAAWSARGTLESVSPVLARLGAAPGVAVRLVRPWTGLPGLVDLKRRDHRKLVLVDGRVGILGGRNLGEPYLRGFDEVPLWTRSFYREVPWLDASAEVEGPVLQELFEVFAITWEAGEDVAGSSALPPLEPPGELAEGRLPVRLVRHEGLEDVHGLELYRELIDGAQQRLAIVNTFPLQFELLAALRRAVDRGVCLRVLVGNVRPLYLPPGQLQRQAFPGGGLRDLATSVIHGRLDELVEAGARVHELALPARVGWDPALGRVLPHVHAKCISVDGRAFAIGSANLDVTAAYWESEVMLLVEDPARVAGFDATLDELFDASMPMDPEDPAWREQAGRRAWISRNWPSTLS